MVKAEMRVGTLRGSGARQISDCRLVGDPNVRIRQVKAESFYVVQALVHIKVCLDVAPVQVERFERRPWSVLRGQVPSNVIAGEAEDAAEAPEYVHLHFDPSFALMGIAVDTLPVSDRDNPV
jgi:hypothetical protein